MSARRRLRVVVAVLAVPALLGAGAGTASGEGVVEGVLSRVSATVDRTAEGTLARQAAPADASQEGAESSPGPPAGGASAEGEREASAETAGGGGAPAAPGASPHNARSHASGPAGPGAAGHPFGRLVSKVTSAVPGAGRAPAVGRVVHDVAAPALAAVRSGPVPTLPIGETLPAGGAALLRAAGGVAEGLLSDTTTGPAGGVLGTPVGASWEPPLGPAAPVSPVGAIASLAGAGAAGPVFGLASHDRTAAAGFTAQAGTGGASARAGRQRAGIEGAALGRGADLARAGGGGGASRASGLTRRSPLVPSDPGSGVAPALAGGAAAGIAGIAIALLMALVSRRPPGLLRRLLPGVPRGPSEPFALLLSRPG